MLKFYFVIICLTIVIGYNIQSSNQIRFTSYLSAVDDNSVSNNSHNIKKLSVFRNAILKRKINKTATDIKTKNIDEKSLHLYEINNRTDKNTVLSIDDNNIKLKIENILINFLKKLQLILYKLKWIEDRLEITLCKDSDKTAIEYPISPSVEELEIAHKEIYNLFEIDNEVKLFLEKIEVFQLFIIYNLLNI